MLYIVFHLHLIYRCGVVNLFTIIRTANSLKVAFGFLVPNTLQFLIREVIVS